MLDTIQAFLRARPSDPAVAAAVTVLAKPAEPPLAHIAPALKAVAPHLTETEHATWADCLAAALLKGGITTPRRVAAFLGQCAVESGGFRVLQEDLEYSAERLCEVWPNRFANREVAEACAMRPEALANDVYANRMGNGGPETGDGWRFRGRGLIQITGRSAYERFGRFVDMTLDQAVDHAGSPAGAADSAVWFWSASGLNHFADAWSLDIITRAVNGGMTSAAERSNLSQAALHTIGV